MSSHKVHEISNKMETGYLPAMRVDWALMNRSPIYFMKARRMSIRENRAVKSSAGSEVKSASEGS